MAATYQGFELRIFLAAVRTGEIDFLPVDFDRGDRAVIHFRHEFGIGDDFRRHARLIAAQHLKQGQNQHQEHEPEGKIACIAQRGSP